jgi:hypothetical protein
MSNPIIRALVDFVSRTSTSHNYDDQDRVVDRAQIRREVCVMYGKGMPCAPGCRYPDYCIVLDAAAWAEEENPTRPNPLEEHGDG